MNSKAEIRRIQAKRIMGKGNWEWVMTEKMTWAEATRKAAGATEEDETIYAIRITRMTKTWDWVEEFSGDRDFNYIGVAV